MPDNDSSSAQSDTALLSKDAIAEIIAEAIFRADQKQKNQASSTTCKKQEEEETGIEKSVLLSQVEAKPGSSTKKSVGKQKTLQSATTKKSKLSATQTKKKIASLQKLQNQLAGQVAELLEQLE